MDHEFDTLDLRELFYMLVKHMRLIALLTVISVSVTALATIFLMTPTYETFTTLMLGKPVEELNASQVNNQGILTNQQLIGTYAEIAKSKVVINKVVNELGNTMTPAELRSKVSVTLLNNTAVIKVGVKDSDPERAAVIANAMAKTFMAEVSNIMKIENVQVIDPAEVPVNPISPRLLMNLAISLILGLMLGVFISFLIEFMDRSVKTPEDVQKYLGLPVLGMIPEFQEGM